MLDPMLGAMFAFMLGFMFGPMLGSMFESMPGSMFGLMLALCLIPCQDRCLIPCLDLSVLHRLIPCLDACLIPLGSKYHPMFGPHHLTQSFATTTRRSAPIHWSPIGIRHRPERRRRGDGADLSHGHVPLKPPPPGVKRAMPQHMHVKTRKGASYCRVNQAVSLLPSVLV